MATLTAAAAAQLSFLVIASALCDYYKLGIKFLFKCHFDIEFRIYWVFFGAASLKVTGNIEDEILEKKSLYTMNHCIIWGYIA